MPNPNIKTEITVKVLKKGEREARRYSPMLDVFNHQFSALMMMVKHIRADKNYTVPPIVERLFEDFGSKA